AVFGEFDAEAVVRTAVQALQESFDHQARAQLHVAQPRHDFRIEERGDALVVRHAPEFLHHHSRISSRSRTISWSALMPSAPALRWVTARGRRTAGAMALPPSTAGVGRPSSTARALAPSTRCWPARGPAPQPMNSCVPLPSAAPGRVARAKRTAYAITWL